MLSLTRFSSALVVAFAVMAASNASAQPPAPKVAPSSESPGAAATHCDTGATPSASRAASRVRDRAGRIHL
jgi:hypothetical protein